MCLVGLGVTHLVTLSMDTPPPAAIRGIRGLRSTVIPIKEFRGPRVDELIKFNELVSKELGDRGQVAVHCRMGRGRTGTVLAAYMMAQDGLSALEVKCMQCSEQLSDMFCAGHTQGEGGQAWVCGDKRPGGCIGAL